jgi:ABC-type lipoprotein release transport system permease subunit
MVAAPALILVISLLASIVPAWTAANGKPLTALRDS